MCTVCGGMEVHVSNIPEGLDKNQLLEYFQSQEHGGSYMTDIAYPLRNNEAVLLYKHHKGVELLSQNKHFMKNNQLNLKVLPRPVFVSMTATLDPDITNLLLKNDKYIRDLTSIPRVRFGIDKRTSLYGLEGTWYSLECAKVLLEKMQETVLECESPKKMKDNVNDNLDMQRGGEGKDGRTDSPQQQTPVHRQQEHHHHPGVEYRQGHVLNDSRGPEENIEDGMKIESSEVVVGGGGGGGMEFDSPMHRRAYMKLARERFLSSFYQPEKSICDEYHYPDSQWEVYKKEGRMRNLSLRSNRDDSQERDKQKGAYDGGSSKCAGIDQTYSELNHLQKSHTGWAKQGEDPEMSPCHKSSQIWTELKSRDARNYSPDRYHEKRGSDTMPNSERRSSQHVHKGLSSCDKDCDASPKHCYSQSCKDGRSSLDRRDNSHNLPRRSTDDRDCDATPTPSQRRHNQHWDQVKERVEKGGYIVRDSGDGHCDDKDTPDTPHKTRRRSKNRKDHRGSTSNEGRGDSLSPHRDQSHDRVEGCRSKNNYRHDPSDNYDDCSGRRGSGRPWCDKKDSIGENHRDLLDPTWLPVEKGLGHRRGSSPDGSCDNSPSPHRASCHDGCSEVKDRKSSNQDSVETNQSSSFRRGSGSLDHANPSYSSPRRQGVDSADSGHCPSGRQHHGNEEKRSGRRSPLIRHRHSSHEDSAEFSSSQSRHHGSHDDRSDPKTRIREKQRHSSNEDSKSTQRQRHSSEEQADGIDSPVHHSRGRRRKPKRQNPPRNSSLHRSQKECSGNNQCGDNDDNEAPEVKGKSTIPRCVGFRDKDLQFLANFALHFQGGVSVVVVCENIINIDTTVLVSPTNQLLQNTGGIAQAISHAAGPDFDKMCREISMKNGLLDVSNIVCTRAGGLLRANYVIHVSAPFYNDYADIKQCHSALVHSYINCINYANGKLKARSIAFPPISTAETIGFPQVSGFTLAGSFGVDFDLSINAFYDALLIYTSDENTPKLLKDIRLVINDRDSVTFAIIILNQLNSMDSREVTEAALERYKYSYKKQTKKSGQTKKQSSDIKCSETKVRKSTFEKDCQLEPPEASDAIKVMALSSPRRSPSYTQAMCQLENGCLTKTESKVGCNQKSNSLNFRKKGEYKIDEESPDGITSCLSALIHQTKTTLGAIRETNLDRKRSSSVGSIVRNRIQSSVVGGSDMDVRVGARLARSSSCQLEKEEKNGISASSEVGGKGSKDAVKGSKSASSSASGTPSKNQQATSVKQALLSTTQKVHSTDSSTPRSGFQPPKDMGGGTSSSSCGGGGGQEKESKSGSLRSEKSKKENEKSSRKENQKKEGEKSKNDDKSKKDVDYDMRATNHIAALFEMEREVCAVCKEKIVQKEELCCGHSLCKRCYREITKRKPICPICGTVYAPLTGDQPKNGKMSVTLEHKLKLPGFETANGTIVINYTIPDGIQEACHPNPGKRYHGTCRTAYLPNNRDGNEVLKLLQRAFESRLTFTVGQSQTTGRKNVVTWTDINHKTSPCGGPANCGYPDASYLAQVRAQLERKGIK